MGWGRASSSKQQSEAFPSGKPWSVPDVARFSMPPGTITTRRAIMLVPHFPLGRLAPFDVSRHAVSESIAEQSLFAVAKFRKV